MKSILSYYNQVVLAILLIVINLSYHPAFHVARADATDADVKSVLSKYVLLIAGLLVLPNIRLVSWLRMTEFKKFVLYTIPLILIALVINMVSPISKIYADCSYFIIPLVFFLLGCQFEFTEKQTVFFSLLYVIFALLTGISQVLTNIGSFVIMEQYMVSAKNSMACMFAIGIVISLFWALSNISRKCKLLFGGIFLLLFTVLFTIRGRAGILASIFACSVIFYKYLKSKNISSIYMFGRVFIILLSVVIGLLIIGKFSYVWDFMYNSFFSSYSGDVSSGRTDRNIDAIGIILNNPFVGRIGDNTEIEWVHNYILRILSEYGLFLGGYILIPYYFILKHIYQDVKMTECYSVALLGNITLIVPFVISLFEPTFPYSPGSTIMFAYFLYGISYSSNSKYNSL